MDDFLNDIIKGLTEICEAAKKVVADRISSPFGYYDIQTGPLPSIVEEGGWMTVIGVTTTDGTCYGPVSVQRYPNEEEAKEGHNTWRHNVMDSPPLILKDTFSQKITTLYA